METNVKEPEVVLRVRIRSSRDGSEIISWTAKTEATLVKKVNEWCSTRQLQTSDQKDVLLLKAAKLLCVNDETIKLAWEMFAAVHAIYTPYIETVLLLD